MVSDSRVAVHATQFFCKGEMLPVTIYTYLSIIILSLMLLAILKNSINRMVKKSKGIVKREDLNNICSTKLPNNITICNQMLEILENKDVIVTEEKDLDSCLYTVFNNKITLSDKQTEYIRLQTIAHECIHSVQDKKMLWFNFIFSNIYFLYFFITIVLTIFGVIKMPEINIAILVLMGIIHHSVRSYLEEDAIVRAKLLAEEYMDKYNCFTTSETEELLSVYDDINKLGIPITTYSILFNNFLKVIIYTIVAFIMFVI